MFAPTRMATEGHGPSPADEAVIERVLRLETEQRATAEAAADASPGGRDLRRLETLGSEVFGEELFTRRAYAAGLRAVHALVSEVLAQDRAQHGQERSEAMEHAVHDVAAALGVTRRTAEIRVEDALVLVDELPRTLAVLKAGYLPVPSARALAQVLAGRPAALRGAAETSVLDTLGRGSGLALGSGELDDLTLTARLEPSRAATVSLGASRRRVRDLAERALREFGELLAAAPVDEGAASTGPTPLTHPARYPGDVEAWQARPGYVFVGAELTEADAAVVLDRIDHLARADKRAGDPRSLPELRVSWFADLLLSRAELAEGSAPVPVHLTVHLLDERTAVDADRLGPLSAHTLADLVTACRSTGGRARISQVRMPDCPAPGANHRDVHDHNTYTPSDRLREAVRARDRTCRFPGCTVAARDCDLDHSIPHPRGPTCDCNLSCLCRRHHRLKTSGRWRLINHGHGRLTWISPTGRTYEISPDPV